MQRRAYPTDLSEEEWAIVAPWIPLAKPGGRPRTTDMRAVLNAIFSLLRSGGAWRLRPQEFPAWQTVYAYFRHWQPLGVWEQVQTMLRERVGLWAGREGQSTASLIDSQSVKTTERGGVHGYDGGKKIGGRKRHILVDTLGLVLKARVHAADILDRDGARLLLASTKPQFPRLGHLWTDMGYRGTVIQGIEAHLGWTVEVVKRPSQWGDYPVDVELPPLPRFTVLPRRWVVERTFAGLGRYHRMSKDYEYLTAPSEALIYAAMSRLMLRRLTKHPVSSH